MASGVLSLGTPGPRQVATGTGARTAQDEQAPRLQRCCSAEQNLREAKLQLIAADDLVPQAWQCRNVADSTFEKTERVPCSCLAARRGPATSAAEAAAAEHDR